MKVEIGRKKLANLKEQPLSNSLSPTQLNDHFEMNK